MGKRKVLVKSKTRKESYDIISANVHAETIKIRAIDPKTGKQTTRTYTMVHKHGLSPKRIKEKKKKSK